MRLCCWLCIVLKITGEKIVKIGEKLSKKVELKFEAAEGHGDELAGEKLTKSMKSGQ